MFAVIFWDPEFGSFTTGIGRFEGPKRDLTQETLRGHPALRVLSSIHDCFCRQIISVEIAKRCMHGTVYFLYDCPQINRLIIILYHDSLRVHSFSFVWYIFLE